jgi:hypothetical protein
MAEVVGERVVGGGRMVVSCMIEWCCAAPGNIAIKITSNSPVSAAAAGDGATGSGQWAHWAPATPDASPLSRPSRQY